MDRVLSFARSFLPELALLLVMSCVVILNIGAFNIDPFSEFFHLEAAKESLSAGRFWSPVLNGHEYVMRSPFWTWLVMIFFKFMGVNLWAARLPAIICYLLGLVFTYLLTMELTKSRFAAFFSAAVLGSTWGYFHLGSLSTADILATVIFLAFGWAFTLWHNFAGRRTIIPVEMKTFSVAFGALLGLLVLVKGSGSVILLLLIAASYLFITQSFGRLNTLNPLLFLGPLVLIPFPWLLWVSIHSKNPTFLVDYLVVYPFEKLAGLGLWQSLQSSRLFYFKRLFVDLMPYWFFLPGIIMDSDLLLRKGFGQQSQPWMSWLLIWFSLGFVIYSLSSFQEPTMMLPFYPPIAILVGSYLAQAMDSLTTNKVPTYHNLLIVYITLMMVAAVVGAVLVFQIIPSNYVAGFWRFPGQAVIESIQLGEHVFPLTEVFPLWKFWLIPGPFILLIGGFVLFLLQAERRLSLTPWALMGTFIVFLLFIKMLYLPIIHRPVPETFAKQLNRQVKPGDQIVLYSFHPDIKRVLFYLDSDKLPMTRLVRKPDMIQQNLLSSDKGMLYGVMREDNFFDDLAFASRSLLQVTRYDWNWDSSRLAEMRKFLLIRQPHFDRMKSELIFFQSLPPASLQAMRDVEAEEELMANPTGRTSRGQRYR